MGWLAARIGLAWAVLAAAALSGHWLGLLFAHGTLGAVLGVAMGAVALVWLDLRSGLRMMDWLRGPRSAGAPRDAGFWGELAYRVERALRSSELAVQHERERLQQFLSAIEASPNGVMLLDAQGHIEWCNSVAATHFGLDPVRDIRQRVTNLLRAPAFVAYLQAGQFDKPVVFDGPLAQATLSVLVRPYGNGLQLVLSQDITESERADAMRRDFVANVSHEIRTPLTVVAGFIETMASLPLSEPEREHVLDLMQQQTSRMQNLVGDLLTLAKLEGSPRPPLDGWLPAGPLLKRALADARALSQGQHSIELRGADDAQLAGSETELLSAIGNLLNNAVRYTPAGGSIGLQWRRREDGGADLEVIDTGIGIAREHLPRLTERFYRVDGSRSRDTGGTGLGLSIVKHVAQRHGGEIDVSSEPGKGSTFRIVLPALRVRSRPPAKGQAAEAAAASLST